MICDEVLYLLMGQNESVCFVIRPEEVLYVCKSIADNACIVTPCENGAVILVHSAPQKHQTEKFSKV